MSNRLKCFFGQHIPKPIAQTPRLIKKYGIGNFSCSTSWNHVQVKCIFCQKTVCMVHSTTLLNENGKVMLELGAVYKIRQTPEQLIAKYIKQGFTSDNYHWITITDSEL